MMVVGGGDSDAFAGAQATCRCPPAAAATVAAIAVSASFAALRIAAAAATIAGTGGNLAVTTLSCCSTCSAESATVWPAKGWHGEAAAFAAVPGGGAGAAIAAALAAPLLAARRCWQGVFLFLDPCPLCIDFAVGAGGGSSLTNSSVIISLSADDFLV